MARKNILTKVKTSNGFDTLYSLTPYQIITATNVQGNGSNYVITVPLPTSEMIVPILIRFTANADAQNGCTVSINSGTATTFMGNVYGIVEEDDDCLIYYDLANSKCYLVAILNKGFSQQHQTGGSTSFSNNIITENRTDGSVVTTTFNSDGSITEEIEQNGVTVTKTTNFNADGSITEVIS